MNLVISDNGCTTVTSLMAVPGVQASQANQANQSQVCDVANVRVTNTPGTVQNTSNGNSANTNTMNSTDTRQSKERRRRERRERRARRQRRHSQLINQMDGYMYEGSCFPNGDHLPDLLNNHLPPPAYTTLPGRGQGGVYPPAGSPTRIPPPPPRGWRASIPGFSRRSRNQDHEQAPGQTYVMEEEAKSCCGVAVSQTVSIRWFIVMIAFVGICCAVVGTVLGAMKASGREHLTVSLLMIGVGIVLITVSGIAWRLTSQDAPSCRAMLGLSSYQDYGDGRFLNRPPFPRSATAHPYAGMMYSEFQYRPPPPSYQASMQEYRLRLLLMDRSSGPPPPPPPAFVSPPPAYRGPRNGLAVPHEVSRPPSYRSRASDIIPIHGRHPSQLSYLSFAGGPAEPTLVEEEPKDSTQHASVVPVIPNNGNKASIRIHSSDMDQYITNIQDQFEKIDSISCKSSKTDSKGKASGKKGKGKDNQVTIVQNTGDNQHLPVVVTVSGALDVGQEQYSPQGEVDILAHL